MGGRPKATAKASGTLANSFCMAARIDGSCRFLAWRSSQGVSRAMMVATLELLVRVTISSPPSVSVPATPGILATMSSILRVAASARGIDEPSGRRMEMKTAPWSSSGRKPLGIRWKMAAAANQKQNRPISASAGFRISAPTPAR